MNPTIPRRAFLRIADALEILGYKHQKRGDEHE
jgi:hypothetical protein